jgi:hypothetical protein
MKKQMAILFAFATALLLLSAAPAANTPGVAPAFDIRVDVHPSNEDPYQLLARRTPLTYTCSTVVFEADSQPLRAYGSAELVVSPGGSEKTKKTFGEFAIAFVASVNQTADRAQTDVTIMRGEKIIARQHASMLLKHQEPKFVPVR